MALHAIGLALEKRGPPAQARPIHGRAGGLVHGESVVPVHDFAGNPVPGSLVGERPRRALFFVGRRVRPSVELHDEDERQLLHRGEVQALVKRPHGGPAVSEVRHADRALPLHAVGEKHSGDDRHERAEHRDRGIDAFLGDGEVEIRVLAAGGRGRARHVLREDVARRNAAREDGAEVPDERREEVAFVERERGRHGRRLLPERPIQAAHDLPLPVQVDEPLLEKAVQQHAAIEVGEALRRQRRGHLRELVRIAERAAIIKVRSGEGQTSRRGGRNRVSRACGILPGA